MRTRKEIEIPKEQGFNYNSQGDRAILEVLLDNRELLENIRDLLANHPHHE